ncbi:MAG TPA: endonuclease/exonuclease/phosphatase family protein, partial [Blastocatellia bacterium]|nr:endonuclease/exonuclease/phosphatase family protein [Blastocatellia bacterium]
LVVTLAACLLYQAYRIFPYTVFHSKQVQQSRRNNRKSTVSLVIANVLMHNRQSSRLRQIIRDSQPDIVLAVETDDWWEGQLKELEKTHHHTVCYPLKNTYGMMLFSRLKLVEAEVRFLVEKDIPSIHTILELGSGIHVELRCLHPRPPFPTESEESTERDAELVIVGKAVKRSKRPVIVAGDLNDVAWSKTTTLFQNISGLLDPRIGRGLYNSFHAYYPFFRWPVDHVFHSTHFRLIELKRLEYFGSDHFPIFVHLSYEPEASAEHEQPQADESDSKEAQEKIRKAEPVSN